MTDFYKNVEKNVNKIINRYYNGVNTLICNAPCQSGKTDIAPCLMGRFGNQGAFISIHNDNHLFTQNSEAIRGKDYRVNCMKLHDALKDLESNNEIEHHAFWVFDEAHVGHKEFSQFHRVLSLINKRYEEQAWGKPFLILLGATNWQLVDAYNRGFLDENLFGRTEVLDLEVGEGYIGAKDFLENDNVIFKDVVDNINKITPTGELHRGLAQELDRLVSKGLKQDLEDKGIQGHPMGLVRVSSCAKDGEELAKRINKHYGYQIAFAINSTGGKNIQECWYEALRKLDSNPVIIIACNGISMGVKIPPPVKQRVCLVIEDRKVLSAIAQSFIGRLMGYDRDKDDPFPIPCNLYISRDIFHLLSKFDEDSACLNDNTIEELTNIRGDLTAITMATHFKVNSSREIIRTELSYEIVPEDIKSDGLRKDYFQKKYSSSLRRALTPNLYFERYEESTQNDIQKILLEENEKGGGNRMTCFYNPKVESKNAESEQNLINALEAPNHQLTGTILRDVCTTYEELKKAFYEGRLYRIKITFPNDETAITRINKSFSTAP